MKISSEINWKGYSRDVFIYMFRYCLTRRSYAVGTAIEIIQSNWNILSDFDRKLIQKEIKGFEKNSFYIIKPNEYKCWHRAMAWYDVAEFKEVIQKAEVEHLNEEFNGF